MSSLAAKLSKVYPSTQAQWLAEELNKLIVASPQRHASKENLTTADVTLITYPNSLVDEEKQESPLNILHDFIQRYHLNQALPNLHLLPFYPWDVDRGFSVKGYRQVAPEYGTWGDITKLSRSVKLMLDFVANHASVSHPLVQGALIERHLEHHDPRYKKFSAYRNFVIAYSDQDKPSSRQLTGLTRPRPHPVLTRYTVTEGQNKLPLATLGQAASTDKKIGQGWVWTTFSRGPDQNGNEGTRQVDLNFANPHVLLEVIKILLFFIEHKATFIRLDAIAYIWKDLNHSSIHEPKAHQLLEIIDYVLAKAAPHVSTVAEINEAQDKVLPYLGTAANPQSDLVYQFSCFALAVHAVAFGKATFFSEWLPTTNKFQGRQFTTVLGSHDGLALKPVRGILPEQEITRLVEQLVKKHNGLPNYAHLPGGQSTVYEVCATPWHLINSPNIDEPFSLQLKRYQAVLALGLMLRGMPGIYINGLLGSKNYLPPQGLDENRTINREIFDYKELCEQLDQPDSHQRQVMDMVVSLLKKRAAQPAFAPDAKPIQVLNPHNDAVVAARLEAKNKSSSVLSLVNVSTKKQKIQLPGMPPLTLEPYQVLWQRG